MARKHREEEHENHERWLVSYADFITLLFAFFTVMYATSNRDLEKEKKFEDSVKKAFVTVAQFGKGSGPGDFPDEGEDASIIAPPIEVFRRRNVGATEMLDAVKRVVDKELTKDEQKDVQLELKADSFGVRLSLDSAAMFDSGSTAMKPQAIKTFDKIAQILKETEKNLIVEGHTDNQPIRTAIYPSNWELAGARASTIVRYLITVHQIEPSRLSAVSLADQRPIASNATEEGRKKNRRIEILLTTKQTGID